MITSFLSVAVLCTASAMACPGEKAKVASDSSTGVEVRTVALESGATGDCALACDGEKAVVQNVALKTEAKDCSEPCSDAKMAACDDKSGFAVPSMTFRVGDKVIACPVSAKAVAAEQKADMGFVVEGVAYQTESEAKVAHMVAMQQFTDSLTRVTLVVNGEAVECAEKVAACKTACESTTVQYQVGPVKFDNAEDAVRAAAAAHAAMQSVKMSYAVNGEATNCSVDAKAKSTSCGAPVEFVVNGSKTACTKTADYLLTQERMAAAVAAMQKAIG